MAIFVATSTTLVAVLGAATYAIASLITAPNDIAVRLQLLPKQWLAGGFRSALLYICCVCSVMGIVGARALRHERKKRRHLKVVAARERLRALRTQLNPHLLFNVLNAIADTLEIDPATAEQLVTRLGALVRRTLRASEREQHSLRKELAYVDGYLQIQQLRQPVISWCRHVDAACLDARVPTLLLLPLVENAVTHGLQGNEARLEITLDARCDTDALTLKITNTCGSDTTEIQNRHLGLGLRVTRERLQILFGAGASLTAGHSAEDRYEAEIRLPRRALRRWRTTKEELHCAP